MSRVPTSGIDYTSKDYESFRNDMIKGLKERMPEYTDFRQSDAGIVILELLAQGLDILSYYQDVQANESFLVTAENRGNALKWCQMLNYTPRASTPAEFTQVFVLSSPQDTDTVIPAGTKVKTQSTATEPSVYFETTEDLVIPAGALGNEVNENDQYVHSVKVVQGVSVYGELLGTSTGTKDQSFTLSYSPVILDSISVIINEGSGYSAWKRVENFVDSSSTSKDYTVQISDNDEATITFGDGVFGKIPRAYENGIYCTYRVGGGTQGNVGAFKISLLDSNIALVSETFNPYTADVEGIDKESLEDIKVNAPVAYRTRYGALTCEDFAGVVRYNFGEVLKSTSYAVGEDHRDLDIYVILRNDGEVTEDFKKKVLELFDANKGGRKIIGANTISIYPAKKVPLNITATLAVKNYYDFESVKEKVSELIRNYFEVGNYEFDTELSLSTLSMEVMNPDNAIEGIRFFKIDSPSDNVLVPGQGEVYVLNSLVITNGGV